MVAINILKLKNLLRLLLPLQWLRCTQFCKFYFQHNNNELVLSIITYYDSRARGTNSDKSIIHISKNKDEQYKKRD